MSHSLQRRISVLRSRARLLMGVRGLSLVVAAVLATVMALGSLDYVVRFQDRGVLAIFSAAVVAVLAWAVHRYLYRPRAARLSDTELALHVEACFPIVRDRLASALEFLKQPENDAAAGSAALRRAVIAQASAEADGLDFGHVLDLRPTLRATLAASLVMLCAVGLAAFNPMAARIALARLASPFGPVAWPQVTHLKLKQPVARVARGQAFEVEVVDSQGARLPNDCRIHYRFHNADGRTSEDIEPMQRLGASVIARRENLVRGFEFRVTGGDDVSMGWMGVEVLEPPAVGGLTLDIRPPEYANMPAETRDAASNLPLLAGTRVRLRGEATKPLRAATLRMDGGREIPATVEEDGLHFKIGGDGSWSQYGLLVEQSASYGFQLRDRDDLSGGGETCWQFRVVPDAAPTVVLEQPSGNLFVTPRAVVNLRVRARDDLALREVALVYQAANGPDKAEKKVLLYEGPQKPQPKTAAALGEENGDQRAIDYRWDLEGLKLSPGTQLTVHVAAADYRPQAGRSEQRLVSVITSEELQGRMAARQAQLVAELARVLQIARDGLRQVDELGIRLRETQGLSAPEVDRLQAAEFNQREVARALAPDGEGVPAQARTLLDDLRNNRLDDPDFQRRLEGVLSEAERLQREHLPQVSRELTAAIKSSQVRLQAPPAARVRDADSEAALGRTVEHQKAVVDALDGLLSKLRRWDDYRRFHRDVAKLLRDQEELARNAAALGGQTLTRDLKELSPEESADVKVLAASQVEMAQRMDRIEQEMEQAAAALHEGEPLAAEVLADAVAEARRLAVAAAMRTAGGQIENNRMGQVAGVHQEILRNLQEVLDILANNRRQELDRLMKKIDGAARDLDALRQRQEEVLHKLKAAGQQPGTDKEKEEKRKAELQRLAREEKQLAEESRQLARRLERLLAEEAGQGMKQVADKMEEGGSSADRGDQPKAIGDVEQVLKGLDDVRTKIRDRKFELQALLAMEQLAKLEDAVKHLQRQEQRILDETREFDGLARSGELTRAQITGLRELARQQELLRDEADRLAKSLDAGNVFRVALSGAAADMGRAAAMLDRRQTGASTQQAEQAAIARLALARKAIEPEKPAAGDNNPDTGGDNQGPKKDGPPGGVLPLAELKMLKLLQEDVLARTSQLQEEARGANPPDDLRQRHERLAEEQRRLSEMTYQLLAPQPDEEKQEPKEEKP